MFSFVFVAWTLILIFNILTQLTNDMQQNEQYNFNFNNLYGIDYVFRYVHLLTSPG